MAHGSETGHGDDGPEHLAHHWDTTEQQFSAAKLGMWLFLATEVLLFGGLFCVYAALRYTYPEIFSYGSQFLDTRLGMVNTVVLIASSFTMATGVTAAQRGRYRTLVIMLAATFVGGAIFMTVKYVEYHHKFEERLVWGAPFYAAPDWARKAERARKARLEPVAVTAEKAAPHVPDATHGREIWNATCRSCHGAGGEGISGQGKDIRGVEFVTSRGDDEMLAFLKVGRRKGDILNTTGVDMPPKGGNPLLTDNDLLDALALVRSFKAATGTGAPAKAAAADEGDGWIPKSSLPLAPPGPAGLRPDYFDSLTTVAAPPVEYPHHAFDAHRPEKAHLFFGIYFLMTGLHGAHVLIGMLVIAWLGFRAMRREFGPKYFTPVDLGGLYWHVVDVIWILLFPMLYLIV